MRKTQKVEYASSLTFLPGILHRKPAKADDLGLVHCQFQSEFLQPLPQFYQYPLGLILVLDADHKIIRISYHCNHTSTLAFNHSIYPEVEYIMQINICQNRGDNVPTCRDVPLSVSCHFPSSITPAFRNLTM